MTQKNFRKLFPDIGKLFLRSLWAKKPWGQKGFGS